MKRAICCLALLGYRLTMARGQALDALDTNDDARIEGSIAKNVAVLVEYIAVDHTDLTKLLRVHRREGTDTQFREDVRNLMDAGQAKLVEITQLVTRNGHPAQSESVVEIIYPTEHDPAELPQKVQGPIEDTTKLITSVTPTAFQTLNIGFIVKATPQLSPRGAIIDINLVSELVTHDIDEVASQRKSQVKHPLFDTMRVNTSLSLRVGEYMLAGVHTPSAEFHAITKRNASRSSSKAFPYLQQRLLA